MTYAIRAIVTSGISNGWNLEVTSSLSDRAPSTTGGSPAPPALPAEHVQKLVEIGRMFHDRNWSLGTSSNYSVVLGRNPLKLLITASGRDKRSLGSSDFVIVGDEARPLDAAMPDPSAETWLHIACAKALDAGAVLHTHSVWSTILSDLFFAQGHLPIEGYEMLKGLTGIRTHEHRAQLAIFENTQDIPELAALISQRVTARAPGLEHGFLLRRHGLYTWGRNLAEARRHVEILEFLFEVLGRRLQMAPGQLPSAAMDRKDASWPA